MKNKENSRGFIQIILILVIVAAIAAGAYYFGTKNKSILTTNPIASAQPSESPSVKPTADPTANWKTYTDTKFKFSFKYPTLFQIEKPTQEALPDGEVAFYGKEGQFWVDAVSFNGTLDQFVKKYTALEPANGLIYTNLNVSMVLGDLVKQDNSSIVMYKYVNHYDQSINPGAKDVISYTGFFVSGNFGYIFRSATIIDNRSEIDQILSTFKFTK